MNNLFKLLIISALTGSTLLANAFDLKEKPVQVIMPFAPGGGVDQTFRHLQKYAAQKNITLVGIYKPGAEGLISMSELTTLPKDGYHVSVTTASVIGYFRMRNPSTDIIPITGIRDTIMSVVSSNKSNIKTLDELEGAIKKDNNLTIGYGAPGQKLFIEQLLDTTKSNLNPILVPYKGGGPVLNDLIAGHINAAAVPYAISKSHIAAGRINLLALSSREKLQIPVVQIEQKYPKWQHFDGFAFVVAEGTDKQVVKQWSDFLREYVNDPQVQKDFIAEGTTVTEFGTKNLEKTINNSIKKLSK